MSSLVTAALTAFFGVLVFVFGQLAQKFILEPIQEQRKVIGEIAYSLLFHANAMDVSRYEREGMKLLQLEEPTEVAKTLRSLAGKLRASLWTIPFYNLFAKLKVVPKEEEIMSASQSLVGWSNSIHSGNTDVHRKSIAENLRLKE
jgi:hypothetical protein